WVNTFETPYSGLMETMQDFDLVDDQGRSLPIQAAGARLIARSNASILGDDVEGQLLISTLDLPLSVEPFPWDSYVLRDGDPIMVVGFKTTIVDPSQPGMRQ